MGKDQGTDGAAVTDARDPEQLQREIEQTREQLGDTVEALARKADIKAQARQKVEQTKASVTEKKERLLGRVRTASPGGHAGAAAQVSQTARENPVPLAVAAAFAAGFLAARASRK